MKPHEQDWSGRPRKWYQVPSMKNIYDEFGGRTTTFAWAAFVFGAVLAWFGKLDGQYIALVSLLGALIGGRSAVQDFAIHKTTIVKNGGKI